MKNLDIINEELTEIKEKLIIKEEKLFNIRNGSDIVECSLEKEVKELRKKRRELLTQKAHILKRKGKVEKLKSEIVNLKINYIKRAGRYEFSYDKMDDGKWYHYRVNYTFDETNHIKNDKLLSDIYGKGKYEKLDLDLCEALREFDVANGTRYCRNYINDTANFNISYDMRGRNKKLSRKENKKLDKVAEIQSMFKNAKLRKPRKKLSYTLAGLSLMGILSLGAFAKNNDVVKNEPKEAINKQETTREEIILESKGVLIEQKEDDINEKEINSTLYSTYDETGKHVNTEELNCGKYNVNLVAVYKNETLIEVINISNDLDFNIDDFIESYKLENGEGYDFSINVDGYDTDNNMIYKQIGWTKNLDLVRNDNKHVLVKTF